MKPKDYEVVEIPTDDPYDKRYAIIKDGVVDDAQGYGYKTKQNAHKAYWFKFGGGKQKIKKSKKNFDKFYKSNKEFVDEFKKLVEMNCDEICKKEVTMIEILKHLEKEFNVEVPVNIVKNLFKL